jgi:hypothetical protein
LIPLIAYASSISISGGGAATPAGNDTEVQYNSSGAFAGSEDFTYGTEAFPSIKIGNTTDGLWMEIFSDVDDQGVAGIWGDDRTWVLGIDHEWTNFGRPEEAYIGYGVYVGSDSEYGQLQFGRGWIRNNPASVDIYYSRTIGAGTHRFNDKIYADRLYSNQAAPLTNDELARKDYVDSVAGVTLPGADGSVQYAVSSAHAASTDLVWDNTTKELKIGATSGSPLEPGLLLGVSGSPVSLRRDTTTSNLEIESVSGQVRIMNSAGATAVGYVRLGGLNGGFIKGETDNSIGLWTGSVESLSIDANSNTTLGKGTIGAGGSADGHTYMPSCDGLDGGTPVAPTSKSGFNAFCYDNTAQKLCIYSGGWRCVAH